MNLTRDKLKAAEGAVLDVFDARQDLARHKSKKWRTRQMRDVSSMVWHHAAGELPVDRVAAYHVGPNHISQTGCPGICYHFFIGNDGAIYWCNDLDAITWSNGVTKYNNEAISVCFEGDLTKRMPTPDQIATAVELFKWSTVYFNHVLKKTLQLYGHSEVKQGGTVCPGAFMLELVKALRSYIKPIEEETETETETESEGELMTLVEAYQKTLKKFGHYKGEIDNDFGPLSKAATSAFQREEKLDVTGTVNNETTEVLLRAIAAII